MPGDPLSADKPLNPRQERFCLFVASGMSFNAACLAAGYKSTVSVYLMLRKPNVRARLEALRAEAEAASVVTRMQLTQRLLAVADRAERAGQSPTAALLREERQALLGVARINGLERLPPAKPALAPISEIRRMIVYPDGYATDYNGNPLDPNRPPYLKDSIPPKPVWDPEVGYAEN